MFNRSLNQKLITLISNLKTYALRRNSSKSTIGQISNLRNVGIVAHIDAGNYSRSFNMPETTIYFYVFPIKLIKERPQRLRTCYI